jgi:hypothetical protein
MNENTTELTITLKVSRFLTYILGSLEKVPIEKEEATILQILNIPSIHIQFDDLETLKELQKPLLWQQKEWFKDITRREKIRKESELRRIAANKQSENIQKVISFFMAKYHLPEKESRFAAEKMIIEGPIDKELLKQLGIINIQDVTPEEKKSLGTYYKIL